MAVAPSVDPVTTTLEALPLFVLFELLDLALRVPRPPRRTALKTAAARDVTGAVSAGWVLPVDGPPLEDGYVAWEDGRIVEVGAGPRRAPLRRRGDPAGARQRALAPRVRGLRRLRRRPAVRRLARDAHRAQARARRATRWSRSPGAAPPTRSPPGITTTADYSFSGAAATAAAELGLRAIVYLEVFGDRPGRRRGAVRASCARARRGDRARADRHLAARAVHLLARGLPLVPLARDPRRHAPRRERRRERVARARHRPAGGDRDVLVAPTGQARRRDARGRARPGAPLRPLRRTSTPDEIALLAARRRPGRALPALERAARLRHRAARRRSAPPGLRVGLGTDSPASTPSFDPWEELRAAVYMRARARAAPGRARRRTTRCASRRSTRPRALGLDDELGSLTPGKRADLTVALARRKPVRSR